MTYRIEFSREASRVFQRLSQDLQRRLDTKIQALSREPRPVHCSKMAGVEDAYRIRVGDYRVVYRIYSGHLVVLVLRIGHRREVYRGL